MPEEEKGNASDEFPVGSQLIKLCGEFWNPEFVNWNSPWRLLGKRRPKGPDINVWRERGIYVLFEDYAPVYVGRADKQSIGDRLLEHRSDWKKGARWNSFTWFGIVGLTGDDKLVGLANADKRTNRVETYHVSSQELLASLEAILIAVIDPRLNSKREWLKGVTWLYQSDTDKPPEIDERLDRIEQRLAKLLQVRGSE